MSRVRDTGADISNFLRIELLSSKDINEKFNDFFLSFIRLLVSSSIIICFVHFAGTVCAASRIYLFWFVSRSLSRSFRARLHAALVCLKWFIAQIYLIQHLIYRWKCRLFIQKEVEKNLHEKQKRATATFFALNVVRVSECDTFVD